MAVSKVESKILESPPVKGATFGMVLEVATGWIPLLWNSKVESIAQRSLFSGAGDLAGVIFQGPISYEEHVEFKSQRSLFSGALAGAITHEIFTDGGDLLTKTIAPKIYSAITETGANLGSGVLKIGLIGGIYFGLSNTVPDFGQYVISSASFLKDCAFAILNNTPVTQELAPEIQKIAEKIFEVSAPVLNTLPFEPEKLAVIMGSLYLVQKIVIAPYWKDFKAWRDHSLKGLHATTKPYIETAVAASSYATTYYLSAYFQQTLGGPGSALAAAIGIPAMVIARESIRRYAASEPSLDVKASITNILGKAPQLPSFRVLENLFASTPAVKTEPLIVNEPVDIITPEEELSTTESSTEEPGSIDIDTQITTTPPWTVQNILSGLYAESSKFCLTACTFFSEASVNLYSICEKLFLQISMYFKKT